MVLLERTDRRTVLAHEQTKSVDQSGKPRPTAWTEEFDQVLEKTTGFRSLRVGELWQYRELLYFLVWRDIKVRYKQTVLGAGWAILQPVLAMVLFTVFFGARREDQHRRHRLSASSPTRRSSRGCSSRTPCSSRRPASVNRQLITKVYFPRLCSWSWRRSLAGLVDFVMAFVVLLALMVYYGIGPALLGLLALLPLLAARGSSRPSE